ncbi:MAG: 3-phosphoserine/phosphohydroxythreonine transaminase [Pseudomonadota bacterium]
MINFSPGPAALPPGVRDRIRDELDDWSGTGLPVMEQSHRAPPFMDFAEASLERLRSLLAVPQDRSIVLVQGGASSQFALLPMNLHDGGAPARYATDGHWGRKALREAARGHACLGSLRANIGEVDASYVHVTSNETIEGLQWHDPPVTDALVVCDMSSDIAWAEVDLAPYDCIYAAAQKNLGIAGVTLLVLSPRALARSPDELPTMLNYRALVAGASMSNTPPTFAWYVLDLVVQWIIAGGGLAAIGARNRGKADSLYGALDASGFYRTTAPADLRSAMNVTFRTPDEATDSRLLTEAAAAGFVGLKGHKAVGGLRASLYNAIEPADVHALVGFLQDFERRA